MNSKRCLVIGGNGFIGIHLVKKMIGQNAIVRVLDINTNNLSSVQSENANLEIITGSLLDRDIVSRAVRDMEYVFFYVSATNVLSSIKNIYKENDNLLYLLNVLEEAVAQKVKKVIFASSGGTIYGEPEYVPIDEAHPQKPISPYGIMKLTQEKFLHYYKEKYNLDYCICRYSNPYGPMQDPTGGVGAITIFLYNAIMGHPIHIFGDPGKIIRDYIFIDDVADATIQLAFKETLSTNIFNIGSGMGTSLQAILDIIRDKVGKNIIIEVNDVKKENVSRVVLDIAKVKTEINWEPIVDLSFGVEQTYNWIDKMINKKE